MSRQRGTVKWFSREKGWGFIRLESGDEIFVHHSDIEGEGFVNLQDDEPVEFTVEEMEKGPRARNVRSLSGGEGEAATEAVGGTAGEPAGAGASHSTRAERSADHGRDERRSRRSDDDSDDRGLRPLAEQLMERLGRRFPGLRG